MNNLFYQILFMLITFYIFLKAIGYALYEIQELNNKKGGITVIVFSTFVIIFVNIVIFI